MPVKNQVVAHVIFFVGALSLTSLPALAGDYGSKGAGMEGMPDWSIQKMDKDGDGKISKDEFQAGEQHFEYLDENGDGYVTEKEWPKKPMKGHY